ncbi:AraC family transcriptional regulator [Diaphorobacter caeni]|uniref:AraC family transcriptional regulator n=1 Tax=Diaphorobacter caeni TaxID=2784387 RepID=UPI001E43F4DF|nr:AraC family transcriptional regulator [Diaphorobacter caeni]
MTARYLTRDAPCIPTCRQPALALAFAQERELSVARVLTDTGLNAATLHLPQHQVSPAQLLLMLHNLARVAGDAELPFVLGSQWLPGHYGAVSHVLLLSANLRQALTQLARWPLSLSPLMTPRVEFDAQGATLHWHDAWGVAAQHAFLVDLHMSAVAAMTRWLSGERLPWQFRFNRTRPREIAAHEVHLGHALAFGAQRNSMHIGAAWLDRSWPRGNAAAVELTVPQAAAAEQALDGAKSLLTLLYDHLQTRLHLSPTLDDCAQWLSISPATLKRHLAHHGTHYQAELDQVRAHVALDLLQKEGLDNATVASRLGFHDSNNFRRAFKRWTGLTPSQLAF